MEVFKGQIAILTWEQPEMNFFREENFTYVIMVLDGEQLVKDRIVTLEPSHTPSEVFNLTDVEPCQEVTVTLIQLGDCREEILTTIMPICETLLFANTLFYSPCTHSSW